MEVSAKKQLCSTAHDVCVVLKVSLLGLRGRLVRVLAITQRNRLTQSFFFFFKGVGNKTEISVKGQEKLNSSSNQRNEKATVQNASSPETTPGSTGRQNAGGLPCNNLAFKLR